MKKLLFRICLMMLALVMVLGAVACSKADPNGEGQETNTTTTDTVSTAGDSDNTTPGDTELKPNFSGNTYGGRDFTILNCAPLKPDVLAVERLTGKSNSVEKAIYERNTTVEEQFDINFVFLHDSEKNVKDLLDTSALSEVDTYDFIGNQGRTLMSSVFRGSLVDWNDIPTINLDAPWWSQGARKSLGTPGGKVFVMNGDLSWGYYGGAGGMYFNKDMIENAHLTSPYTYFEENNWTFETFFQLVKGVADSVSGDGRSGYVSQKNRGASIAYTLTGLKALELQPDGRYIVEIKNQRAYDAMDIFSSFVFESGYCIYEEDLSSARNMFKGEVVAFFDDNIYSVASFSDVNFGFVLWPKYDNDVENYVAHVGSGATTFAIPFNTSEDNRKCIGDVVEGLAYYGSKTVVPTYVDNFISYQKAPDQYTAQMFDVLKKNIDFNLADYLNPASLGNIGTLMNGKPDQYSSLAVTIEKLTANGQLEVALQPWYNLDK